MTSSNKEFDRVAEWLLFALIIGTTLLQKLSIPIGGGNVLPISFFLMLGVTAFGVISNRLEIRVLRCAVTLAMIGGLASTQLLGAAFGNHVVSLGALSLMAAMHLPYAFGLKQSAARSGVELNFFQNMCVLLSLLGIAQYFLQFVIGWQNAFFLDATWPGNSSFLLHAPHMNNLNEIGYRSNVYKSNGVFLNEASFLSQFLSLAFIIEVLYYRRILRIALYLFGIAVTFSGTGLILILAVTPLYLLQQRQFLLLFGLVLIVALAPVWAPLVGLEHTVARAGEFFSETSSGYARFVSPFRQIEEFVFSGVDTILFGNGSGSISRVVEHRVDYATFDPTWAKLVFEYGFCGALFYMPFVVSVFLAPERSAFLKIGLLIAYFILGGNLAAPYIHLLVLALLAWPAGPVGNGVTKPRSSAFR